MIERSPEKGLGKEKWLKCLKYSDERGRFNFDQHKGRTMVNGWKLEGDNSVNGKEKFVRIRTLHEITSRDSKFLVIEMIPNELEDLACIFYMCIFLFYWPSVFISSVLKNSSWFALREWDFLPPCTMLVQLLRCLGFLLPSGELEIWDKFLSLCPGTFLSPLMHGRRQKIHSTGHFSD